MKIRTRWLPLFMLLGLFPVYLFVPFIAAYVTTDRAFVAQLLTISLFVLIALWIFRTASQSQLKVSTFFRQGASIGRAGLIGLVLALFVFSLGASSVTFAVLSHIWPGLVTVLAGPEETSPIPWVGALSWFLRGASLIILAPLLEEILFRGILLNRWTEKWGLRKAIVFSSASFGALHADPLGAFVFAGCMCILYIRTGSLRYSVFAHAVNNAIVFSLISLPGSGTSAQDQIKDYRLFPWFGIVCVVLSLPFIIAFVGRNWPARDAISPYRKWWIRTPILRPPGEPDLVDYSTPGPPFV